MSDRPLRIGTRGSALALAQSGQTARLLEAAGIATELVVIKTSGDRLADVSLAKVGGKGLFIKELEEALAADGIDLAIHSMKDVPADLPAGFALVAVTARADVRDVVVRRSDADASRGEATAPPPGAAPGGSGALPALARLSASARVGTGSLRRRAQLAALRPDLQVIAIRGNVDTRIRKLESGEVDAVILAAAGLGRLGLEVNAEALAAEDFLPAPGQGALAVETRVGHPSAARVAAALHHAETATACAAERAFLRGLGASCQVPVAAFARREGEDGLVLDGLVASLDGVRSLRDTISGSSAEAESLGRRLAQALAGRGALEIVAEAEEAAGRI